MPQTLILILVSAVSFGSLTLLDNIILKCSFLQILKARFSDIYMYLLLFLIGACVWRMSAGERKEENYVLLFSSPSSFLMPCVFKSFLVFQKKKKKLLWWFIYFLIFESIELLIYESICMTKVLYIVLSA